MPRVLMNFQFLDGWTVHFIEADCKSIIGRRTRYFKFATAHEFREFVSRCNLEHPNGFEAAMQNHARGSEFCRLTDEQYARLRR